VREKKGYISAALSPIARPHIKLSNQICDEIKLLDKLYKELKKNLT